MKDLLSIYKFMLIFFIGCIPGILLVFLTGFLFSLFGMDYLGMIVGAVVFLPPCCWLINKALEKMDP